MRPHIHAVHAGRGRDEVFADRVERTAIRKSPVTAPVHVGFDGLDGDERVDPDHAGAFHAVYAFAQEDLDLWSGRLGVPVPPGHFGENLTTAGIDVNEALVGEQWRVGTALLEVVSVRIPCSVFKRWMGATGFEDTAWVKRFTAEGRPGPYLRVLEPGTLAAGDDIVVEHRPDHDVTVSTMFAALTTRRDLLPRLAGLDRIDPEATEAARAFVAAMS
ncbi:MAG: MOSC domain-containing protein [Nocardioides sp.]